MELERTDSPGHGAVLAAQAVQRGAQHIVAVGGDGTVHDVANGMLRHATTAVLGVVPVGTGNDFAKLVGVYRHDPVRAVARLVGARAQRFDVGQVGDEYFVNSMGVGFGPEVLRVRAAGPARSGWLVVRDSGAEGVPRIPGAGVRSDRRGTRRAGTDNDGGGV